MINHTKLCPSRGFFVSPTPHYYLSCQGTSPPTACKAKSESTSSAISQSCISSASRKNLTELLTVWITFGHFVKSCHIMCMLENPDTHHISIKCWSSWTWSLQLIPRSAPRGSIPGTGECHTQIPIDTEIPEAGEVTADHPEVTNWSNSGATGVRNSQNQNECCQCCLMHSDLWMFQSRADLSWEPQILAGPSEASTELDKIPHWIRRSKHVLIHIQRVQKYTKINHTQSFIAIQLVSTCFNAVRQAMAPEMALFNFHCTERAVMVSLWPELSGMSNENTRGVR